jgi:hypothetical protein
MFMIRDHQTLFISDLRDGTTMSLLDFIAMAAVSLGYIDLPSEIFELDPTFEEFLPDADNALYRQVGVPVTASGWDTR